MGNGTIRTITGEPSLKNTGNAQMFLHITSGGTGLYASYMTGGTVTERPSSPIEYASYYNTTTKVCEYWNGSQWSEISLPIAIVTRGTSGFTSIDQVFNGFGYIGNTIFTLPGISGLIPNGRNEDGSLNSVSFTTTSVLTSTKQSTWTQNQIQLINANGLNGLVDYNYKYDEYANRNIGSTGFLLYCVFGAATLESGRITSFNPKPVFHAVDYYDFLLASDQISTDIKVSSPTGTIVAFGTGTAPQGFLPCNGAAVSRTTYANLFSVIGTTWGAGDGISTFNLPNLNNGIFLKGGTNVGKYTKESLPNITGGDLSSGNVLLAAMRATSSGAMQTGDGSANRFQIGGEAGEAVKAKIDASLSSATYQDGAPVQPNNYTILFCIKY